MMNFSKVRTVRKTETYTRGVLGMKATTLLYPGEDVANALTSMANTMRRGASTVNVAEIGSRVRPETIIVRTDIDPQTREVTATETIASFLARGGSVVTCKPARAKGAPKANAPSVRVKGGRNMANTQLRSLRTSNQFNQ